MSKHPSIWPLIASHLKARSPSNPVIYFAPSVLQSTAQRFIHGFDGLVTYAVKANDRCEVLENILAAGVRAFDVASPVEMRRVQSLSRDVVMHYNNPVRSRCEINEAQALGVKSYSIDSHYELEKLVKILDPNGIEISVRLRLPVAGAAYDFGAKFGADPNQAASLLQRVRDAGFTPSMTFHPGTQCEDGRAWATYISRCAQVAKAANVRLARLNVGGGFAADRGKAIDLEKIFDAIHTATRLAFGAKAPALVCEPGRAMVSDAFTLATQVKSIREDGAVFLNDGVYGALSEAFSIGVPDRIAVIKNAASDERSDAPQRLRSKTFISKRVVFGPTCDSIDQLPEPLELPLDLCEEDYVIFQGMGAYSLATATSFNGYGQVDVVNIHQTGLGL